MHGLHSQFHTLYRPIRSHYDLFYQCQRLFIPSPPFCIINRCKLRRDDAALVSVSYNSELRCLLLRGTSSPTPLIYYSEMHFRPKSINSHHRSSTKAPRNVFFMECVKSSVDSVVLWPRLTSIQWNIYFIYNPILAYVYSESLVSSTIKLSTKAHALK